MTTLPADAVSVPGDRGAHVSAWQRISWGPIMMGAVSAIGLQFVFTVLGLAIGVTATDAHDVSTGTEDTVRTISVAAGAWWLITGTIALFIGGFVFGKLSGLPRFLPLQLEALAMWAVVAIFGFFVIWSGAGMASATASPLAAVAGRAPTSMNSPALRADPTGNVAANIDQAMRGTDRMTTNTATAEEARKAARTASWWSVIGLLAGIAAAIGGAMAAVPGDTRLRRTNA